MNETVSPSEYLVISRGQWDADAPREEIQQAIDQFYVWLERLVAEGKMKTGQRLANRGKTVGRKNLLLDGPYGESKEVVGGFWFAVANTLEEAAEVASTSPTLKYGLFYEIRPVETERCRATDVTTETPGQR